MEIEQTICYYKSGSEGQGLVFACFCYYSPVKSSLLSNCLP